MTSQVTVSIAGNQTTFAEDSFQLHYKLDERQHFQCTVEDYAGTASYSRGQQLTVTDPTLGRLFGGVVVDDKYDKQNTYPDPTVEHQIDTVGNEYFADKRTTNRQYTSPTYASKIVADMVSDVLAAEGVVCPLAQQFTTTQANWASGTLVNTAATLNVGDGDLELGTTGGTVNASYSSASDWNTGTLTNVAVQTGGDLSLNGVTRNWDNGSITGQTLYGNANPAQSVSSGIFQLSCGGGVDKVARSRLDFAGTWANGTIEVDINLDEDVSKHSLEYRTTNWNNLDDYAYAVEVTTSKIELRIGNNGAGGATSSLALTTFTNQLAHGWYRLRLVLSGGSHTAFLNGTQYVSASDSTYTSAGYLALRNRNVNSSGTEIMQFDNFGVMAATSGTWQSAATSINSVSTIATSTITWDQSLSTGGTILVQTSIDGGSTFQTCSNGGVIPGLTSGVSGTGKTVIVKLTLSNTTTATMPDVKSLQWSVVAGYSASGTWVSPTLSLAPVGRVGSSVIAWNATLPSTATTLGVDISLDGGTTWRDVTNQNGGPIPSLDGQPDPSVDSFATNTSANYTLAYGYGGGTASWTFDTANSRVIATGGASAMLLNPTIDIENIDLFVDMDYADGAGVCFCIASPGDYYGLIASDNQSSINTPNTMRLFRYSGNVRTTVASGAISFQRGTYHRVRATCLNGVITCAFDGTTVFTYTDGAPLGSGPAGLYQAGGLSTNYALRTFGPTTDLGTGGASSSARFCQLWITPMGDQGSGLSVTARCRLATTDSTKTPQVLDLTVGVYSNTVGVGVLIPSADYRQQFISKVFDDLSKQCNYAWWIDQNKTLNFRSRQAIPAPWIVQSSTIAQAVDLEVDNNLQAEVANDLYRNRQVLQNVIYTASFTSNFQGDGQTASFTLTNPVAPGTVPTITLNTVKQKVQKKGTTGAQFYYADNDPVIAQDKGQTVLVSTDRLAVAFTGTYTDILTVDNTAAQTALALVEGGTGIVEAVEDVSNRNMTVAAATTYANQLLVRYCIAGRTLTFATYRNGLQVGQIINTFIPELGLFDTSMLIQTIDITMRTQPGSTFQYQYVVQASELPNKGSWQKLLASALLLT